MQSEDIHFTQQNWRELHVFVDSSFFSKYKIM